ncbi:acyl-CoA dehydrogenase family protein [Kitasatospora sp. NPDC094015]|uniref:acyl-CoA dehydrogenase family protein n=1 Tax=Kitasatospora sp. NPDC094015 TaxID=3155205 RepID=UPI003319DEC3
MSALMPADRPALLDALLGDPRTADGPLGPDAVVAADERGELPATGVRALAEYGFNADLLPPALGGRFTRVDELAGTFRAVARRDLALATGYGLGSLTAALHAQLCGDRDRAAELAELLLGGGRVATAFTAPGPGLRATPDGGRLQLSGTEHLVGDPAGAAALLLPVTLDRGSGHLLLPATTRLVLSPPHSSTGLRGCRFAAVTADGLRIGPDRLLDPDGDGPARAAAVGRVTGTVVASALIGVLDTQLRTALSFADERILYGRPVTGLPSARALLVDAFLDLLIADCCSTVAARALHLRPGHPGLQHTVRRLVTGLVRDAVHQLSLLLGARSYLREGPHALFQKHLRDRTALAALHAEPLTAAFPAPGSPATDGLDPALFGADPRLPDLDLARLADPRVDPAGPATAIPAGLTAAHPELAELAKSLIERPDATGLAAAACLQLWWHATAEPAAAHDGPVWIHAALHRLAVRAGRRGAGTRPDHDAALLEEMRTRLAEGRTFDLAARPPAG